MTLSQAIYGPFCQPLHSRHSLQKGLLLVAVAVLVGMVGMVGMVLVGMVVVVVVVGVGAV